MKGSGDTLSRRRRSSRRAVCAYVGRSWIWCLRMLVLSIIGYWPSITEGVGTSHTQSWYEWVLFLLDSILTPLILKHHIPDHPIMVACCVRVCAPQKRGIGVPVITHSTRGSTCETSHARAQACIHTAAQKLTQTPIVINNFQGANVWDPGDFGSQFQ